MPIPELEEGVTLYIRQDIMTSDHVNELLRSRSLSIYTAWEFEIAWIASERLMSIRIGDDWYWLSQFGWVGTDQLADLGSYSVIPS
jgi:hypothetical protein